MKCSNAGHGCSARKKTGPNGNFFKPPGTQKLNAIEKLDWLRLARSDNVGPITFYKLLERFGGAGAALDALPELARHGGRANRLRVCAKADAEKENEA